jgi:hypothetical protein
MASRIFSIIFSSKFAFNRCIVGTGIGGVSLSSYYSYSSYKNMDDMDPYVVKYWLEIPANAIFGGVVGGVAGGLLFTLSPITIPYSIFSAVDTWKKQQIKN